MENGQSINNLSEDEFSNKAVKVTPSAALFVALYLVILAFFIMLNSISTLKEYHPNQILDGTLDAFAENINKESLSDESSAGKELDLHKFAARIGDVAKESVTLVDVKIQTYGTSTELTIPTNSFFEKDGVSISAQHDDFIDNLIIEINKIHNNARIDVEVGLGIAEHSNMGNNALNNLSLARVGNFAKILTSSGAASNSILIGLDSNIPPDKLILRFYVRAIEQDDTLETIEQSNLSTEDVEIPAQNITEPAKPSSISDSLTTTPTQPASNIQEAIQ